VEVTIQDLGSVGEFIAAIATIATLGYLAIQIRQNTKAARRAAVHAIVASGQANRDHYISNPEVAALYLLGLANPDQLSPEDAVRFRALMLSQFENAREYFEGQRTGDLSQEEWAFCRAGLSTVLSQPGGRRVFGEWVPTCRALAIEMEFDAAIDPRNREAATSLAAQQGSTADSP